MNWKIPVISIIFIVLIVIPLYLIIAQPFPICESDVVIFGLIADLGLSFCLIFFLL